MPELPDISAYITALESRIVGEPIEHVRLATPFLLRTVEPPIASVEGRGVRELRRIGKRIVSGIGNAYSDEILHAAQLLPSCSRANSVHPSGKSCLPQRALRFNAG